jgi:hypothetical protein
MGLDRSTWLISSQAFGLGGNRSQLQLYIWVFGTLQGFFLAPLHVFLVNWFQLHALYLRKKGKVIKTSKEMLRKLVFIELFFTNFSFLWSCSTMKFVEQRLSSSFKHPCIQQLSSVDWKLSGSCRSFV